MADNISITPGSGNSVATDDIGGIHYQRVKITSGADGTATDVSAAAPLPTVQTGALPAGTNNIGDVDIVGGSVAHDGVATSANPVLGGAYASAAAPTAVSADGDAVRLWALRNGAQAVNVTAAGALIGGDATNGLDVDVTRMSSLVAGEAFIGRIGGVTVVKGVTLTTDTSAYSAGDLIAETQVVSGAARVTNGTGQITQIVVVDEADQKAQLTIYFLSANNSFGTENAAPSISDANAGAILGRVRVEVADYDDLGGVSVAAIPCAIPFAAVSGTADLYVAVVSGAGAPTYGATSIKLRVGIQQD